MRRKVEVSKGLLRRVTQRSCHKSGSREPYISKKIIFFAHMKKYAVIVAGGSGTRMGNIIPKQFLLLKGKPLLWYTIDSFLRAFEDIMIILVLPKDHFVKGEKIVSQLNAQGRITLMHGGMT